METKPSPSTKPANESRVTSLGLKAFTFTMTLLLVPMSVAVPLVMPFEALLQSTLIHRRLSFTTVPLVSLSRIQDWLAVAVNSKGAFPLLNTSMKWRGWLNRSEEHTSELQSLTHLV